jgi:hypothetical protein
MAGTPPSYEGQMLHGEATATSLTTAVIRDFGRRPPPGVAFWRCTKRPSDSSPSEKTHYARSQSYSPGHRVGHSSPSQGLPRLRMRDKFQAGTETKSICG